MWHIVKREYWVTNNTEIANLINKIVKYNLDNWYSATLWKDTTTPPDNILWDLIYAWDKLLLPAEVVIKWKSFNRIS